MYVVLRMYTLVHVRVVPLLHLLAMTLMLSSPNTREGPRRSIVLILGGFRSYGSNILFTFFRVPSKYGEFDAPPGDCILRQRRSSPVLTITSVFNP